jgi:hypothetical protein
MAPNESGAATLPNVDLEAAYADAEARYRAATPASAANFAAAR